MLKLVLPGHHVDGFDKRSLRETQTLNSQRPISLEPFWYLLWLQQTVEMHAERLQDLRKLCWSLPCL